MPGKNYEKDPFGDLDAIDLLGDSYVNVKLIFVSMSAIVRVGGWLFRAWRGLLMDLGFAGLIEEIEKRFGVFIANAFLAFVLLGAVLVIGRWLIEFMNVSFDLAQSDKQIDHLKGYALKAVEFAVFFFLLIGIGKYQLGRFNRMMEERIFAYRKQLMEEEDKYREALTATYERLQQYENSYNSSRNKLLDVLKRTEVMLDAASGGELALSESDPTDSRRRPGSAFQEYR